jgi:hypothetical protein
VAVMRVARLSLLLAVAGLIGSSAPPLVVVEYQIPRKSAFPHDPAVDRHGIV